MKRTWGTAALLLAALVAVGCRSSSSCGAVSSEDTSPDGVHGCWQYTEDFEGVVIGTPVSWCPTANQLGVCALTGDRSAACGKIVYSDNDMTADQARKDC